MRKTRQYMMSLALTTAMLLAGCSAESNIPGSSEADLPKVVMTDADIRVNVSAEQASAGTRAITYIEDIATLQGEAAQQGASTNFINLNAWIDGGTTSHISGARLMYFTDEYTSTSSWRFSADASVSAFTNYYWPLTSSINFFAYYPYTPTADACITIGTYANRAPKITCNLPVLDNQESLKKEFVYAYTQAQNRSSNGETGVTLNFKHPLARVYINLSHALQRLTLNSVTFKDIYTQGTGTCGPSTTTWVSSGSKTDFPITIEKIMGKDMYAGIIAGPFLVMPQSFGSGTQQLAVNATYSEWASSNPTVASGVVVSGTGATRTFTQTMSAAINWQAGYTYTYNIDLGTDSNGIILNITVDAWDDQGNGTTVDVE